MPDSISVGPRGLFELGAWLQYQGSGPLSVTATASWSALAGSFGAPGRYQAGPAVGIDRIVVSVVVAGQLFADTAVVVVRADPTGPLLVAVELSPDSVNLNPGAALQFAVLGRRSDGTAVSVTGAFEATGGSVSPSGRFTAGSNPGSISSGSAMEPSRIPVGSSSWLRRHRHHRRLHHRRLHHRPPSGWDPMRTWWAGASFRGQSVEPAG